MSQQRTLPQSKEALLKSYQKRLKDDIKSMVDNYTEIMKLAKVGLMYSCTVSLWCTRLHWDIKSFDLMRESNMLFV